MYWLNENSRKFLAKGYLFEGETAEGRIREIAENAEKRLGKKGFADKFYDYMSKGYYSLATPIWANYGRARGLPISCFGSYVADDMSRILYTHAEVGMMTKYGGGTSAYFGALRPRGADIKGNGPSWSLRALSSSGTS
jgi:ribonucleoside-diphosphate reductase alpha chain